MIVFEDESKDIENRSVNVLIILLLLLFISAGCHHQSSPVTNTNAAAETTMQRLLNGNERFAVLKPTHPDEDLKRLQDAAREQHPFAVVVCCSDSRVSPELIFDQGIGDLFVIRTAGNIIGGVELGSIEYAVEHLGVKLIVVMGHQNCGAVKAFIEGADAPGHIKDIIDSLKQETEIKAIPLTDINRLDDCIQANVLHAVKQLQTQSAIIREKIEKKEMQVTAAKYDLNNFKITIINQ